MEHNSITSSKRMPFSKRLQWFITFAALSVFTFAIVGSMAGYSTQRVLAATIEDDVVNGNQERFLMVSLAGEANGFTGFLNRLYHLSELDKICSISETQYEDLSLAYDTTTELITVGDKEVSVVEIPRDQIRAKELEELVGPESKCKVIKTRDILYMLASFTVS